MQPLFQIGQLVYLRADSSRSGPVIEILPPTGGRPRYRVFHSPTQIWEYHEDQLVAAEVSASKDRWSQALINQQWLDIDLFKARLTAARLSNPQTDNLYALQAARIQYIPFQFKPLLRLLRADQPRLLIADEVGVGKTIEAGLILRELQTRQQLDNILIVCPKALVSKWQKEMRRFDEEFRILTAETLSYCLREADLDGAWPQQYSRAIIHLELLRIEKYRVGTQGRRSRPGFQTLNSPPQFNLTIVDEAHHLRNPGTSSHEIARFLCDISEAVVFLSATPLHLGNRNLYTLLNLLRPDLFLDESVFEEMVEPNQYLNQAIRHIRTSAPEDSWQQAAHQALEIAKTTSWGRQILAQDPRFIDCKQRLHNQDLISSVERVRCLRDLEEVHTLAHIMNRTRRRDIGKFTLREPHTISVPFTPKQWEFYQALVDFRRNVLLLDYSPQVVRLITDTLERQASSCLPALIPALDSFLQTGRFRYQSISDDADFDSEDEDDGLDLPESLLEQADELRRLANELPDEDPKLDRLFEIANNVVEGSPGKLLVFSFFLHTLFYLEQQLKDKGYRVGIVTGKVDDETRERLRDRFRLPQEDPEAIDILLSSEVGCEGLDYEFCDRLVNYDIPWNPMRIEQRIGRIDRFGQKSEKVLIFNFVTPRTVEERIFFRCFDRLGIFQDTIGDLEEVLGNIVQDLTRVALDPDLSAEQAEVKAQQLADNKIRLVEEQQRLEAENGTLLGLDEGFTEEVDALLAEGKFVQPDNLRQMIEIFLSQISQGGQLAIDAKHLGIYRLRLNKEGRNFLLSEVRSLGKSDRTTTTFTRWLEGNDPHWLLTFDQKIALAQREIPFITPIHPLARIATSYWTQLSEVLTTQVAIRDSSIAPGQYLFACDIWETVGLRSEIRLICQAWNLEQRELSHEVSLILVNLLNRSEPSLNPISLSTNEIEQGIQQLDESAHGHYIKELAELRDRNNTLLDRKLASLDAYYQNRLQRVELELSQASNEKISRMREAEKSRIQRDYDIKLQDLEKRRETDIISQRVAMGILLVKEQKEDDK